MVGKRQWLILVLAVGMIVCLGSRRGPRSGPRADDRDVLVNFRSGSEDVMLITNDGNVGIGTSEPQAKLHVAGKPGKDGIMFPDGTVQKTAMQFAGIQKYDSGWFTVSQLTTYTKAHGLKAIPDLVQVWYSNTPDGTGDVVLIGSPAFSGDRPAYVVGLDETSITLRSQTYVALYCDADGIVRGPIKGFVKIVAIKLS